MPQTWEEMVAAAKLNADETKFLDNLVAKIPELKGGGLRQADYNREMNELGKRKKEYDDAVAYNTKMTAWADTNVPIFEELVKQGAVAEDGTPLWPTEKERLAKELEDARKAVVAGADMDPAELDKRVREIVKAAGGATLEEQKALFASEATKMAEELVNKKYEGWKKDFDEKTIPYTAGFSAQMSLAAHKYERETGEDFTIEKQKELYALMAKEQDFDPRTAMATFMKPTIEKKNMEAEIERRANEKVRAMRSMPGGGDEDFIPPTNGAPAVKGAVQRLLEESNEPGDLETAVFAAGRKAAQELRTELATRQ